MPQQFRAYTEESQDGRIKISKTKHEHVRRKYQQLKSQRATARYFGVSRRLITFILYPERYQKRLSDRRSEAVHHKYYDKGKHRLAMRKYRAKKRKLKIPTV